MKRHIIDFFKGMLVGIGNIAPGLSGGVIAVVLNVYSRLLRALNEFFSKPIKVIKENFGLIVGIILGALFSFVVIIRLIETFPIPTMMLFIGFIIGPIPHIYQDVKKEKKTLADYIVFFTVILLIVGMSFITNESGKVENVNIVYMFIIGVITASTMIIPGVSGTAILMILGVFTYLVGTINDFIDTALTFNIGKIFSSGLHLLPFAVGIVIGMIVLAKIVSRLFIKYSRTMNWAVIALLISCPFSIIYTMVSEYGKQMEKNFIISMIVGVIMLVLGSMLSIYMSGIEKKNEQM